MLINESARIRQTFYITSYNTAKLKHNTYETLLLLSYIINWLYNWYFQYISAPQRYWATVSISLLASKLQRSLRKGCWQDPPWLLLKKTFFFLWTVFLLPQREELLSSLGSKQVCFDTELKAVLWVITEVAVFPRISSWMMTVLEEEEQINSNKADKQEKRNTTWLWRESCLKWQQSDCLNKDYRIAPWGWDSPHVVGTSEVRCCACACYLKEAYRRSLVSP